MATKIIPGVQEIEMQVIKPVATAVIPPPPVQNVYLNGLNATIEQVIEHHFDREGHSSVTIELYDPERNIGILGRALQLADLYSHFGTARATRSWNIVYDLTKSHSWKDEELRDLLIQRFADQRPQVQKWRQLAAAELPLKLLPITISLALPACHPLPQSDPHQLFQFLRI